MSLALVLTGRVKLARKAVLLFRNYEDLYAAVIQKDWKLIASWSGKHELYHLQDDPGEERDLAAENPEKVKELFGQLKALNN